MFFNKPDEGMSSIRQGDTKLIVFWNKNDTFNKRLLFNLAKDPLEKDDISNKFPDLADALQQKLAAYMEKVNTEMPTTTLPRGGKAYKNYLMKQKEKE